MFICLSVVQFRLFGINFFLKWTLSEPIDREKSMTCEGTYTASPRVHHTCFEDATGNYMHSLHDNNIIKLPENLDLQRIVKSVNTY